MATNTAAKAAPSALPEGVVELKGKVGDDLVVDVDVNEILTPYTVIFHTRTLMYGRTDRRETVTELSPGRYKLTWSFSHVEKEWAHTIKAKLGSRPEVTLEDKSEKNKDAPYSIGWAVVVIEGA
jgi:hypothetical protein